MSEEFEIEVRVSTDDLDPRRLWPDGDAPAHPTPDDIIEAINRIPARPRDLIRWLGLEDAVEVYVNGQRVEW